MQRLFTVVKIIIIFPIFYLFLPVVYGQDKKQEQLPTNFYQIGSFQFSDRNAQAVINGAEVLGFVIGGGGIYYSAKSGYKIFQINSELCVLKSCIQQLRQKELHSRFRLKNLVPPDVWQEYRSGVGLSDQSLAAIKSAINAKAIEFEKEMARIVDEHNLKLSDRARVRMPHWDPVDIDYRLELARKGNLSTRQTASPDNLIKYIKENDGKRAGNAASLLYLLESESKQITRDRSMRARGLEKRILKGSFFSGILALVMGSSLSGVSMVTSSTLNANPANLEQAYSLKSHHPALGSFITNPLDLSSEESGNNENILPAILAE